MINHYSILIIVLINLALYHQSTATRCYECSSAQNPKEDTCGAYKDFEKEKHIPVECTSDESHTPGTFCMKITKQGPRGFIWDGRWRQVIRRCGSVAENGVTGVCNWGVQENGVYWEECYCSDDSCNGTSAVQPKFLALISCTLFGLFSKLLISSAILGV